VPRARKADEGGEAGAGRAAFHVINFPQVIDARRVKGNEPRHAYNAQHVDEDRAAGRGFRGMMVTLVPDAGYVNLLTGHNRYRSSMTAVACNCSLNVLLLERFYHSFRRASMSGVALFSRHPGLSFLICLISAAILSIIALSVIPMDCMFKMRL